METSLNHTTSLEPVCFASRVRLLASGLGRVYLGTGSTLSFQRRDQNHPHPASVEGRLLPWSVYAAAALSLWRVTKRSSSDLRHRIMPFLEADESHLSLAFCCAPYNSQIVCSGTQSETLLM